MIQEHEIIGALRSRRTLRDIIRENLNTVKIKSGQFDPNGKCNSKCWYCPVKYLGNQPDYVNQMPLGDVELILENIRGSSVVEQNMGFMYSSNYNEVLLYKDFFGFIELYKKYGFTTMLLSNGSTLSKENIDFIYEHQDTILGICFNIPTFHRENWKIQTGMTDKVFDNMIENLDYLNSKKIQHQVSIQMNCITEPYKSNLLPDGILSDEKMINLESEWLKTRFPGFNVFVCPSLVDRAGYLTKFNVLKNGSNGRPRHWETVVGCKHSIENDNSRIYGWLHISAKGDINLCCDDYNMEYTFGNLLEHPLDDIWKSDRHIDAIEKSFKELCPKCIHKMST